MLICSLVKGVPGVKHLIEIVPLLKNHEERICLIGINKTRTETELTLSLMHMCVVPSGHVCFTSGPLHSITRTRCMVRLL